MVLRLGSQIFVTLRTYAKKPGFYSKSLFLRHKYLGETGFAEFAFVSPVNNKLKIGGIVRWQSERTVSVL